MSHAIAVGPHHVEHRHVMTRIEKLVDNVRPDESAPAYDRNLHPIPLSTDVAST